MENVSVKPVILFHHVLTLAVHDLDEAVGPGRPSDALLDLIDRRCELIRDEQPLVPPESALSEEELRDLETMRKSFRESVWQLREGLGADDPEVSGGGAATT